MYPFRKILVEIHVSWHIAAAAAGILSGTALVLLIPYQYFLGFSWVITGMALIVMAVTRKTAWLLALALLGGASLGLANGSRLQYQLEQYTPFYGQAVVVTGRIIDDTTYGPDGNQRLRISDIGIERQNLTGQLWVSTVSPADLKRGDIVAFGGTLHEGFGHMPAAIFRARLESAHRPNPGDIARRVRDWFAIKVADAISEPQSYLGMSYLTGQRRTLPEDLSEQLRILGLTHVVVASGFHLTVLIRFLRRSAALLSKYLAVFTSGSVIGGFLLLTGFSTSMTRAAMVAGLSLLAWYYGRTIHPAVLILVVAAVTVLIDPSSIWADVGWYLSFTAFIGVIILAPLLHHYFWGQYKEPGAIRHIIVATTAAQITTFPVIAYVFGHYSPLALLSNLLILPLVPPAMLLTLVSGLGSVLTPGAAELVGFPAQAVLTYMTNITRWLAASPYAQGEIALTPGLLAISYAFILLVMIYLWRKTGHNFRRDNPIE